MINYLFSSIDKEKGFNSNQEKNLKEDIKNNMRIIYISSIPDNYERNDKQFKNYTKFFNNIGITFSKNICFK